jgi:hypothetical protein
MRVLRCGVWINARYGGMGKLALIALIAVMPLRSVYAYVDPNSAGPLYQFLFPMLVAIAAAIAAVRRVLKRLWRWAVARITGVRAEPAQSDAERST